MTLILLRHGQRENGFGDVSLSYEGQQLAQRLANDATLKKAQHIICSPKARCRQTITPLVIEINLQPQINPDLDQKKSIESNTDFESRVTNYLHEISQSYTDQTVLVCTHSDWLQIAILSLEEDLKDAFSHCLFSCGEYKVLSFNNNQWALL